MSLVAIDDTNLKNIAKSIRDKNGSTDTYKPNEMANAINDLETGIQPQGTLDISANGTYDVTNYEKANVNTPGIIPTGTKEITENGTFDVTNYASANVNVPTSEPSKLGTKTITENGTYNASSDNLDGYNEVVVNVSSSGGGKYAPTYFTFYYCKATNLDYETQNVDTSNMESMAEMFYNASSLKTISPIFDMSNVKATNKMFQSCTSLTNANLTSFGYCPTTTCNMMFYYCNVLTYLDLSNFETPNLTDTSQMFGVCKKLQHIDIRKMNFDKVTKYTNMFSNVSSNCEIIVADDKAKTFILNARSDLTNVKTVAEL